MKLFVFVLMTVSSSVQCYNVLVSVQGLSGSQNLCMIRFAELLAQKGHSVTVLHSKIFHDAKMPKVEKSRVLSYDVIDRATAEEIALQLWSMPWNNGSVESSITGFPPIGLLKRTIGLIFDSCASVAKQDGKIMTELKKTKWDVVVVHILDFCMFGVAESLGVKSTIWMSTAFLIEPMAWAAGVPSPPSYVPAMGHVTTPQEMSIFGRAKNMAMNGFAYSLMAKLAMPMITNVFREEYGQDFPDIETLCQRTQLYYVNSDPFFEWPRPVQHNIVYVGGFSMQKPEPLDDDWQKFVDSAKDGVVIFSLGTVANTSAMPISYKEAFMDAFKRFPNVQFVFRVEGEQPKAPPNVRLSKWLPQKDLLAHPNVRAFITHGGYNSLTEATYMGVPLVVMPLFGDQYANVKRVEHAGVGVYLSKDNLSGETIADALRTVLESKSIQDSADRLSAMIREQPHHPLDSAINWLEFLARFKTLDSLQPMSRTMPLYQYFGIDVVCFCAFALFIVSYIMFVLCRCCCRTCCARAIGGTTPKPTDKKQKRN